MAVNIFAYILVAAYFLYTEVFMRRGATARNIKAGATDKGSTTLIGIAYAVAILLPWLLDYLNFGWLSNRTLLAWIGLALMVLGIVLRVWAMRILGEFYTRTLVVIGDQHVVKAGPYKVVRHPGYLGSLLVWVGLSIVIGNWVAILLVAGLMILPIHIAYRQKKPCSRILLEKNIANTPPIAGDLYHSSIED